MTSPNAELHWYALTVRPQHEKAVACALRGKGLTEFLPLCLSRRTWSDRVKEIEIPLFAGYVFCRIPAGGKTAVLRIPGVNSVVGFGGRPAPIDDGEIDNLRRMVAGGWRVSPWPYLNSGQRIRVERGPLAGLEGVVLKLKDCWQVVVSVTLLQRSVAVEIGRDTIAPVTPLFNPSPFDEDQPCSKRETDLSISA